jgi:murein DD-endopeptidase MepM/ murein hydrolase activator NlpD
MVVPRFRRRESISPLPDARVHQAYGGDAYGAEVAEATERFAVRAQALAEKNEDAATLDAVNSFTRDINTYHNAPGTGLFNKKLGKDAQGLTTESNSWMNSKLDEYARKMRSPRMRENFSRMASRITLGQEKENSIFEEKQVRTWREAETNAIIDRSVNIASTNWQDEGAIQEAQQLAIGALTLKNRGLGDDVFAADLAELDNKIASARLGQMINADPSAAQEWYTQHKNLFNGATQLKAESLLETFGDQQIADKLISEYGFDNEAAALSAIRERYSGARADRLVSRYRQRVAESAAAENRATAERRRIQQENADKIYMQYTATGLPVPQMALDSMLSGGEISSYDQRQMLGWNSQLMVRSNIEKRLRGADPDKWNRYTPEQREREVMLAAGRTQEERDSVLASLQAGVMDSEDPVAISDIRDAFVSMFITKAESENLVNVLRSFGPEQRRFAGLQKKKLNADLKNIFNEQYFWDNNDRRGYSDHARQLFLEKIFDLDPKSQTYVDDVVEARRESILETYEMSSENSMGFIGNPASFKSLIDNVVGGIDAQNEPRYTPKFRKDAIDLSGPTSSVPSTASMVKGGRSQVAGNGYDAPRDNGRRRHGAIDIPAPEGAEIVSADFGVPLTVASKKYSDTAGNMVTLEGVLPDGRNIKVRALHLQNLDGPEKGEEIAPGNLIGYVGDTGSTSHGSHAHIDVTIDGKRVNPDTFLREVGEQKNDPSIPSLDDLFGGFTNGFSD